MTKRFICIGLFLLYFFFAGWQSPALAFTGEQQLFNEAWQVVSQSYVDNSFNHQDWRAMRKEVLAQPLNNSQQTYAAIQKMLHSLDDPFTRFLPPAQYQSLQTSTAGELPILRRPIVPRLHTRRPLHTALPTFLMENRAVPMSPATVM
ncbi:MAG: hypothetical protein AAF329_26285, partial [Cyanobacteria bacterium P01_A01_bin.17]